MRLVLLKELKLCCVFVTLAIQLMFDGMVSSLAFDNKLCKIALLVAASIVQEAALERSRESQPATMLILKVLSLINEVGSRVGRWSTGEAKAVGQELAFECGERYRGGKIVVEAGGADAFLQPLWRFRAEPVQPAL